MIWPKIVTKFINEKTERLQFRGNAQDIYSKVVSKVPIITNDAYRTYKISGIKKVMKIDIDEEKIIPKATVIRMNRADKIKEKLEQRKQNNNKWHQKILLFGYKDS